MDELPPSESYNFIFLIDCSGNKQIFVKYYYQHLIEIFYSAERM